MFTRGSRRVLAFVFALVLIDVLLAFVIPRLSANFGIPDGLIRKLQGHVWWVEKVTWSPDSKYIASCSSDNTVQVWEAATGRKVKELTNFEGGVYHLAWSPDGKYLATSSAGVSDIVKIWDVDTWQVLHTFTSASQVFGSTISWSPDSKNLAVSANREIVLWDVPKEQATGSMTIDGGAVSTVWSPNGKEIAFGSTLDEHASNRGIVVVWSLDVTRKPMSNLKPENAFRIFDDPDLSYDVAWSPDGMHLATSTWSLATSTWSNEIQIWDLAKGKISTTLGGQSFQIKGLSWSPDGKNIASGSGDGTVKVWEVASGINLATYKHEDEVRDVEWSPDGQSLASASADHNVYLWKAPNSATPVSNRP